MLDSFPCELIQHQHRIRQPLRSTTITAASSLLRTVPPLCPVSVLDFLQDLCLKHSLSTRATDSHVPSSRLSWSHAVFMPDAARSDFRLPSSLSPLIADRGFRHRLNMYRHLINGSLAFVSHMTHLTCLARLFLARFQPRLLIDTAARWFALRP